MIFGRLVLLSIKNKSFTGEIVHLYLCHLVKSNSYLQSDSLKQTDEHLGPTPNVRLRELSAL